MNLQIYIDLNRLSPKNKPTHEHAERWKNRMVASNWDWRGEPGGEAYLASKWAKNIGADKCIAFARYAEEVGCDEVGRAFWKKAFMIEHPGESVELLVKVLSTVQASMRVRECTAAVKVTTVIVDKAFPPSLQPGCIIPMQPQDGKRTRESYVEDPAYWGQRKRNGEKLILPVSADQVWYQARSGILNDCPEGADPDFEAALTDYAQNYGAFILEGEAVYYDCHGGEHMKYASCLAYNLSRKSERLPVFAYEPFACLFHNGLILNQFERVELGLAIADQLRYATKSIKPMQTYKTTHQKQELCAMQVRYGCEGEVWFTDCLYLPGKQKGGHIIRTKYRTQPIIYHVANVRPGRASGHAIAGIEVADADGNNMGTVATGYTPKQQVKLLRQWQREGTDMRVLCDSYGFTHTGKLNFGVFLDFVSGAK